MRRGRRRSIDNRAMSDTTLISVVAIVVAGVGGPAITSWATTRGQGRKFRHERAVRDTDEVRRLVDETGAALNEVIRHCASVGSMVHELGIGRASSAVLGELEEKVEDFEATSARLRIRTGPESEVADVCAELVDAVERLEGQLTYIGMLIRMLDSERGSEAERKSRSDQFQAAIDELLAQAKALRELRPVYIAAAHRLAGAELSSA